MRRFLATGRKWILLAIVLSDKVSNRSWLRQQQQYMIHAVHSWQCRKTKWWTWPETFDSELLCRYFDSFQVLFIKKCSSANSFDVFMRFFSDLEKILINWSLDELAPLSRKTFLEENWIYLLQSQDVIRLKTVASRCWCSKYSCSVFYLTFSFILRRHAIVEKRFRFLSYYRALQFKHLVKLFSVTEKWSMNWLSTSQIK